MPRLIDDLRACPEKIACPWFVLQRHREKWNDMGNWIIERLRDPQLPVLLIDNVADYYYSSEQEHWDLRNDFPNLAPPYPIFWAESKMPKRIHSKECGDTDIASVIGPNARQGSLIVVVPREAIADSRVIPDGTRWILQCEQFHDYGMRGVTAMGPVGTTILFIDADGHLLDRPGLQVYCAPHDNDMMQNYITYLHPALLAVSFLHCKNVTLVDAPVPAPLAKKYQRKHGILPVTPKTLIIEPLKQILRHQGRSHEVGVQKALHICRGHFRDYREGRGLFGKLHGVFWTPQTLRGSRGEKPAPREIEIKIGESK